MKYAGGREVPLSYDIVTARDFHGFYQFGKLNRLVRADEVVYLDRNDFLGLYQLPTFRPTKKKTLLLDI